MLFTKLITWPQLLRAVSSNKNTTISSKKPTIVSKTNIQKSAQRPERSDTNKIMETTFNENVYSNCCGNGCIQCVRIVTL